MPPSPSPSPSLQASRRLATGTTPARRPGLAHPAGRTYTPTPTHTPPNLPPRALGRRSAECRLGGSRCLGSEEDRVPVVRTLVGVAALAGAFRVGRAASSRSSWPRRSRSWAPTAPTSGSTTSPGSSRRRSRSWRRSARGRRRIEIGTAVIDMRYENPLYMVEDAGAADLIAGGRLQLGISRGSPEQVIDGFRYFGYEPAEGETDADMARQHTEVFLEALSGPGFAQPNPRPMFPNPPGLLAAEPHSPGLRDRIWWGAGSRATAEWAAQQGMNLMSSTLLTRTRACPFHELQAEQIRRLPRRRGPPPGTSASRGCRSAAASSRWSTTATAAYFGRGNQDGDQVGYIDAPDQGDLRALVRRRARRPRQGARRRTRRSRPPTRCCSPCRTSSASTTTPTPSRASSSTWPRSSAGGKQARGKPRHSRG